MDFETKIVSIKDETQDVKTFRLSRPKGLEFTAGQFFLMLLPGITKVEGQSRPFTFASSPTEKEYIDVTIKVMGDFTQTLFTLKEGQEVIIRGPKGEQLNYDDTIDQDVIFLAGGSGITPFISAIRYHQAKDMKNMVYLLYSNRSEEDIIFREELKKINNPTIKIINTLTRDTPDGWKGETGIINREMIERNVPDADQKIWFLCGPPPMTKAMKDICSDCGLGDHQIRYEAWELPGKR